MIKYQLICASEHEFEGWFRDSADFDSQSEGGLLECPLCGTAEVRKAIMAPAIAKRGSASPSSRKSAFLREMAEAAGRARAYVEKNFDYVGDKFPEEARKIHYGETDARGIYGEATGREVKDLVDEGVSVAPLPGAKPKVEKAGPARPALSSDNPTTDKSNKKTRAPGKKLN